MVGGVEKNETLLGKDASVKSGEGVGERLAFNVAFAQVISRQGFTQQPGSLRDDFVRSLGEANVRHRSARCSRGPGLEGNELEIVRKKQRLVNFVEIVVFGG